METENTAADEAIKSIIKWIESSTEFVKGELPSYVEQYMRVAIIKSWLEISFSLVLLIVLVIISIFCIKKMMGDEDDNLFFFMGSIIGPIICLSSIASILVEVKKLLTIHVAPKVFILEHLKELIK